MADFDYMGYGQRQRAALGSYGAKAAQNAYARFLSQQRGARKKFDVQQQMEKQAPKVVSAYSRRGLAGPGVTSGIYERGLQDFGRQFTDTMADIDTGLAQEAQQADLEERQLRADYDNQIAQLEAEKQAAIARAAATLSAFKPFLGG